MKTAKLSVEQDQIGKQFEALKLWTGAACIDFRVRSLQPFSNKWRRRIIVSGGIVESPSDRIRLIV